MKAKFLALTVLLLSSLAAAEDKDREPGVANRTGDPYTQQPPGRSGSQEPRTGGGYQPPSQPQPKPSQPQVTDQGQQTLTDFRSNVQRGGRVDGAAFLTQLFQTEGPGASRWIEWMARQMAHTPGGDIASFRVRLWRQYTISYPDDPKAFSGLGKADFTIGDYGKAVSDYTLSMALGAITPENLNGRGLAAERAGDYELAHQDSGVALSMNPKDRQAESLYKLTDGRVSKVYVDLTTGLLKNPEHKPGQDDRGDGAVRALGGTKGSSPPQPAAADPRRLSASFTAEAQRLLQLGDIQGTIAAARKAVALNPDNAQAFNLLAMAYERAGLHDQAITDADNALKVHPQSVAALNTRAWAKSGLKKYTEALADSQQILTIDPTNAFGFLNKARALGGLGRREEMLDAVNRTASLDPHFGGLRDRAVQLAPSADTELLFAGLLEGQQAPLPAQAQAPRAPKHDRLLFIILATLAGGLLIALGLVHGLSPAFRRQLTAKLPWNTSAETYEEPTLPGQAAGAAARAEPAPSLEEAGIPGFKIQRVLATGGMGEVYEAVDQKLGRRVAVKKLRGEIRDDPKERERFLREARTVAGLRHPNIVQIHSVIEDGPDIYLVFEYVDGRPLEKMLSERGGLPWPRVLALLKGVCAALDYAHSNGVIHRDLKPSNVMVEADGSVKVMDFGVARQVKQAMTRSTTTIWGTPCYMAPEAEEGEISRAADIYSLGVCVYEMATGEVPFEGAAGAMFAAKSAAKYLPASSHVKSLPPGLDDVLRKALDPDPKKRQVSAMQVLTELRMLTS